MIYRQATLADAADILPLLLELAPQIPLLVDTLEREEALYALIRTCARSGESWVTCDAGGRIVGVVLAARAQSGRHYAEREVIDLHYAAVAAGLRDDAILERLIENVLGRMVPVAATVSPQNRTGLAARLEQFGFRPIAASGGGEARLWWETGR